MSDRILFRVFLFALVVAAVSFWFKDKLPPPKDLYVLQEVTQEPIQRASNKASFTAEQSGIEYEIRPKYKYELWGLVVSKKIHNANTGMHKRVGDHLNVADICVVWGKNATDVDLSQFKFRNQEFTCFSSTKNHQAWSSFSENAQSNNHVITNNPFIRERISNIEVGDQIYLSGWLSDYKRLDSPYWRKTSVTRTDRGNGACETVYINDFKVIENTPILWKKTLKISVYIIIFTFSWFLLSMIIPSRKAVTKRKVAYKRSSNIL
jgi:hypothetical protein